MYKVDLNSDLGESFGIYTIGADSQIIQHVSSVNVACGWHAGDPLVIDKTVSAAKEKGVAVGAHPGLPDLLGFGRRQMNLSYVEIKAYIKYQLGALFAFTRSHGVRLQHIKPHGALYSMAISNRRIMEAICESVAEFDDSIIVLGFANSEMIKVANEIGLKAAHEVYADRAYQDSGLLVPRNQPGAVIHDKDIAVNRVISMVKNGIVQSINGKELPVRVDSICVHGDNPDALEMVHSIRSALINSGVMIANLNKIIS